VTRLFRQHTAERTRRGLNHRIGLVVFGVHVRRRAQSRQKSPVHGARLSAGKDYPFHIMEALQGMLLGIPAAAAAGLMVLDLG